MAESRQNFVRRVESITGERFGDIVRGQYSECPIAVVERAHPKSDVCGHNAQLHIMATSPYGTLWGVSAVDWTAADENTMSGCVERMYWVIRPDS
jgi:hypothetical protein